MADMPWVRFFPSDWLGGTRAMSAAETGIYITLIATMYERGEPLQADYLRLARLCGASNSVFKKAVESLISEGKIEQTDNGLWNERVGKELLYRTEKSAVALRAVKTRWQGKANENKGADDTGVIRNGYVNDTIQKPEPDTRKKEEDTPTVPKGTERVRKAKGYDPKLVHEFEEMVWKEFPRHPNSRKDPALKKFHDLTPDERAKCIGGVARYSIRFEATTDPKRTVQERLEYVPHLVTWINQKGWQSEYERQG